MEMVVTFQNTFVRWYQIFKSEFIMLQDIFSVCGVRRNCVEEMHFFFIRTQMYCFFPNFWMNDYYFLFFSFCWIFIVFLNIYVFICIFLLCQQLKSNFSGPCFVCVFHCKLDWVGWISSHSLFFYDDFLSIFYDFFL